MSSDIRPLWRRDIGLQQVSFRHEKGVIRTGGGIKCFICQLHRTPGDHPHPRRCNSAGQALPMSTQRRSSAEILLRAQPRGPETIRYVATHCLGVLQQSWRRKREVSSPRWYSFSRARVRTWRPSSKNPRRIQYSSKPPRFAKQLRNSVVQSRVRVRNERSRTRHLVLRAIEVDRDLETCAAAASTMPKKWSVHRSTSEVMYVRTSKQEFFARIHADCFQQAVAHTVKCLFGVNQALAH